MRSFSIVLTTAILSSLALSACGGPKTLTLTSEDGSKTKTVTVEIADSQKERTQGLMERTELKHDTGMLFVFTTPDIQQFWMKNTKIPLDILFFDAEGRFVNALTMEPCEKDPCPAYKAAALSQYVLEVPKSFRSDNKIGTGWKLDLEQVKKMSKPS